MGRTSVTILLAGLLFPRASLGQGNGTTPTDKPEASGAETTLSLDDLGSPQEFSPTSDEAKLELTRSWTDNARASLDLSSRATLPTRLGKVGTAHVIGFDFHKVFSDSSGDWGTLRLQPYLTRLDNQGSRPPFFEDDDDWELTFRFFDFNFTRVGRGRLNFRVGHFEIPFGLEYLIDTNGTVHQFIPGPNIGLKADWGVSINGVLPHFEYEVSLTRGTGNEIFHRGGPFAIAGRIGTPHHRNFVLGLSAFHGRVWSPGSVGKWRSGLRPPTRAEAAAGLTDVAGGRGRDGIIRRTRFGVDVQWYRGKVGLLAEASYGRDYNQDVFNGLAEVNWNNADDRWFAYAQARTFTQRFAGGWASATQSVVGMRYRSNTHWSFSAQYVQDIDTLFDSAHDAILTFQTRYRF